MAGKSDVFPQANSIHLILETLNAISKNKHITKIEMGNYLNIVSRQVDYYISVLEYFELITDKHELTLKGRFINDPVINELDKLKILKNIIIEKPVFCKIDEYIIQYHNLPSIDTIANFIHEYYEYSQSTLIRRASTVKSWFDYLIKLNVYGDMKI